MSPAPVGTLADTEVVPTLIEAPVNTGVSPALTEAPADTGWYKVCLLNNRKT